MSIIPTGNGAARRSQGDVSAPRPTVAAYGELSAPHSSFDFLGAMFRRKFVIILCTIVAALLGWLQFVQQPKVYSSWLKVMIWTKAPPIVIDGDQVMKSVSMTKQQNLISSEKVLKLATKIGRLNELQCMEGVASPTTQLKKMLTVTTMEKTDETLILTCEGPSADELPTILNNIVYAYRDVLDLNSKDNGADSKELITKLENELVKGKEVAERRYLELVEQIGGVAPNTENGEFANPHALRIADLTAELDKSKRALNDILGRINIINSSLYSNDSDRKKIVAIEARKFLGLQDTADNYDQFERQMRSTSYLNMSQRVFAIEQKLMEMKAERDRLSRVFGPSHRTIASIDLQIKYWQENLDNALTEQQGDKETLATEIAETDDEFHKQEELRWITLYAVALDREKDRMSASISLIQEELVQTEERAAKITHEIAELNMLKRQIAEKSEAVRVMLDRLSEIEVLSDTNNTLEVAVIDDPKPGRQVAPVLAKSLGYSIFLGLLCGIGLALCIDRLDMTFRTPSEICEHIGAPVIGRIPRIPIQHTPKDARGIPTLITAHKAGSGAAEAFRAARTAIFFANQNEGFNSFLITSPSPGDGKSTVASNLAISIAQTGKRVVLVDADFRRPRIHQHFDEPISPGTIDVLDGQLKLDHVLISSFQPNLDLLASGGRPKNPGEIVTSPEFKSLILELKSRYDFVLLDSPPLLPVADATAMSTEVDGVYLVLRIRKGVKVSARSAKERLDQVNANVLGVIVNGMDQNPHYSEYGYYYYTYNTDFRRYYDAPSTVDSSSQQTARRAARVT